MKTTAAILVEQRRPLVLDDVEILPLSYGQVLVKVGISRVCGSQLGEIDGVKGPDLHLPHLLGHEAGGEVLEVGPEVKHVRPGDHVVLHWRRGGGIQAAPAKYRLGNREINAGNVTTFQGLTVVSENRATRIPKDVDFETAALLADTLTTGFGVVSRDARVEMGEAVVVIGVGGIGLGVVLGAHLAGAHPIVAVDIHDHKLEKARQFGATHAVNSRTSAWAEAVVQHLGGSADAVFDGTGSPAVLETAWRLTSPHGRVVLVGVMPHDRTLSLNTQDMHHGKRLIGSEGGSSRPEIDIPRYVRMLRDGRFTAAGMVTHRFPLARVNDAIAAMRAGESVHTMLTC
jgi:S-(hydroxymethyl)glutathione dehydrogenase/alcohol dehydrogenase